MLQNFLNFNTFLIHFALACLLLFCPTSHTHHCAPLWPTLRYYFTLQLLYTYIQLKYSSTPRQFEGTWCSIRHLSTLKPCCLILEYMCSLAYETTSLKMIFSHQISTFGCFYLYDFIVIIRSLWWSSCDAQREIIFRQQRVRRENSFQNLLGQISRKEVFLEEMLALWYSWMMICGFWMFNKIIHFYMKFNKVKLKRILQK